MASSQVRNIRQILVGGEVDAANLGGGANTMSPDIASLANGEIGIFDLQGNQITEALATAGVAQFRVVLGRASGPLLSDVIDTNTVSVTNLRAHVARSQEIAAIGFDGVNAGTALEVIADNLYFARLYIQELIISNSDGRRIKQGVFKSTATSTQIDISQGLTKNFAEGFIKEAEKFIAFTATCNAAGATEANNISVVKGSKAVLAAGALTAVVGDFIRLGAPGAGATTASDVYQVVSISGTTYTLNRTLNVATGTYATGTADADVITAVQGAAADCGVVMVGQDLSFDPGKLNYAIPIWEMGLENFGTSSSQVVAGSKGEGEAEAIMELEWFLKGDQSGEIYRVGEPLIFSGVSEANLAVAGGGYDVINIEYMQSEQVTFGPENSPKQLIIAIPFGVAGVSFGYAQAAVGDDITDVLEILTPAATGALAVG